MNLFTKENICDYYNDIDIKNDYKYSEEMQNIRKELLKLEQNTKEDGGVVQWNYMLNDFM